MDHIVSKITSTTSNYYNDINLVNSFGLIVVEQGQNYEDQQKRELPGLLFEFYVSNGNSKVYLENMNRIWTVNSNQPVMIVNMPTDVEMRIVPIFNYDYINTLDNPSSEFDLKVYVDTNISISSGYDPREAYPVGAVYSTFDSEEDPNTKFDFGTWELQDQVAIWDDLSKSTWRELKNGTWTITSSAVRTVYVWRRMT